MLQKIEQHFVFKSFQRDLFSVFAYAVRLCIKKQTANDLYFPALLLLDINLGSKSGFELCKRIRSEYNMPILFISARTSDDDVLMALNIGGDDYIKKPFKMNIGSASSFSRR